MAIAVSPVASLLPPDSGGGSRGVAASSPLAPSNNAKVSNVWEHPGPDDLVEIAQELAKVAPAWRGSTRPVQRRWDLMAASDSFEAWIIAWPPGGSIDLHDHGGSWGAVAVTTGELLEKSVAQTYSGELALRTRTLRQGSVIRIADRHVHDIVNVSGTEALSVHVYAPRLTSMTYYRVDNGTLVAECNVNYLLGEAVP